MLALLYYCFVILIYSPLFVENFNKLAVNMNNPKLCWQSKIGCVNTIARKKLDANLCYKGGIDTAECLAYIASSKGELLVCQMEGVSIADKNKCVEIYAFRKGDIEACEEMSLPKDEIIKLESMKQACVSKVKAKISD